MSSPIAQSVRDRLLNRMRETGEEYQVLLTRFALERLLYRLTQISEGEGFVLKGAFTFLVWERKLGRQTRDLDLLGSGPPGAEHLQEVFLRACQADVPSDGIQFDKESLETRPIRDEAEYDGLRVKLSAYIGSAHLRLQIDVGFGDAVVPAPEHRTFPGLLDFPEPGIKTYRPETVVAEKLHGMVRYGRANTRMKDFYDIWRISNGMELESEALISAIQATFRRRETEVPSETPVALTESFVEEPGKVRQWNAFISQIRDEQIGGEKSQEGKLNLETVIPQLREFILPVLRAAEKEAGSPSTWTEGGPWEK